MLRLQLLLFPCLKFIARHRKIQSAQRTDAMQLFFVALIQTPLEIQRYGCKHAACQGRQRCVVVSDAMRDVMRASYKNDSLPDESITQFHYWR
jgi:hypothetical protein